MSALSFHDREHFEEGKSINVFRSDLAHISFPSKKHTANYHDIKTLICASASYSCPTLSRKALAVPISSVSLHDAIFIITSPVLLFLMTPSPFSLILYRFLLTSPELFFNYRK